MKRLIIAALITASMYAADKPADPPKPAPTTHTVTITVQELVNIEFSFLKVMRWEGSWAARLRILTWAEPIYAEYIRIDKARQGMMEPDKTSPIAGKMYFKADSQKAYDALLAEPVKLEVAPLSREDLNDVTLSAADVIVLKPLLTEPAK
jgi:hypothetical protein